MEIKYKWIFSLILSTNILINLDHGIIPAATGPIEESLKLTPDQLGYLGSLVYAGISLVGIFGGKLFIHFNAKGIIILSYIGMIVSLLMFPQDYGTSWPFYVSRFLTGCAQAPMMIYFPVWVDNFGGEVKTIWMTILQGVIPLGIFVGYVLSSIVSNFWQWHYAFYAQVIMLIPCAISFTFFVKSKDFAIRKNRRTKLEPQSINEDNLGQSMLSQHSSKSYWTMMAELYSIKLWLCCTIVISILYFIVTGIQFWMTDYMISEMHQEKKTVNIVFSVVSITAPVFGCIMGGLIAQKLGGYERTKSLYVCVIYCAICCLSAAPVPFTNTFWFGAMCVWFLLYFGGAIVPPLMGIMLSAVPRHLKAFANSNTTMFQNLFGFLPAPSIYGFLMEKYSARVAVTVLMYYSFLGLLVMFLAVYFKKKDIKKRSVDTIINRTDSRISLLQDEDFNITDRVLQYGDMPLQVSLAQHMDDSPQVFIIGKIAGATNFDHNSIYVKYYFRAGDHWKKISGVEEGETFQSSSSHSNFVPLEHPIDLNYVTKAVRGWPKLLVEVWEVDIHGRNSLAGYGITTLPIEPAEYQIDIPCWRPNASFFDRLIGAYPELVHRDLLFSGESRFGFKVDSTGYIHLELAIITKDFHLHGVQISHKNYLNS